MGFLKYQHLERFGTTETLNIEIGECFIFPKIDGTNASIWLENDELQAGSRTRHLTFEKDNAGFLEWITQQGNLLDYMRANPTHRLFGEWLVPHSLRTYREEAWRRFYVFDVATSEAQGEAQTYLPYDTYKPLLEEFGIDYIPPITKIHNASYDQLIYELTKNVYLIEDGKGIGEGIVIKNYGYTNRFGRQVWAKIVTSEFKEKHAKVMGVPEIAGRKLVEEAIAEKYVTTALCKKVLAKIELETGGWTSRQIPRLLNTVYYDLVREDCWEFIKEHKNPNINFGTLQHCTFAQIKQRLPQLF